jgi:4-hydroxythreonine-4-phosphate dehydrogenase
MIDARPLVISVGDPAGIGPEVSIRGAATIEDDAVVIAGDADRLEALAVVAGVAKERLVRVSLDDDLRVEPGRLYLAHAGAWSDALLSAGRASAEGGAAQLLALDTAVAAVRAGRARALVTGPTSKEAIASAGTPFVGQTEHLARAAGMVDDAVTMMFLGPRLRVALVMTHLAVRDAPSAVTPERVARSITHLGEALVRLGVRRERPRVLVAGLNPHAGEGGLFGDEEPRAIRPGMEAAAARPPIASGTVELAGLAPAESAFRAAARGDVDGVVAMLHDQATIASKLLDWGEAVNVTWGLPFVRTSVDHGVAYDAASAGTADAKGMIAALRMAQRLTAGERAP